MVRESWLIICILIVRVNFQKFKNFRIVFHCRSKPITFTVHGLIHFLNSVRFVLQLNKRHPFVKIGIVWALSWTDFKLASTFTLVSRWLSKNFELVNSKKKIYFSWNSKWNATRNSIEQSYSKANSYISNLQKNF